MARRGCRESCDSRSSFRRDDGLGIAQDGSIGERCSSRRSVGRIIAEVEAIQFLQWGHRLGFCFSDDERQTALVAGNAVMLLRAPGGEGCGHREASRFSHFQAHLYNAAHSEQRGCEGSTGATASCEQSHHARLVCASLHAGEAIGAKQARGSRAAKRQGTGLSGPNWTMKEDRRCLQVPEKHGGDDGTRTRGLCRDRAAF